jgi:large subunit ribosomal protein L2
MAIKTFKPYTPSRRGYSVTDYSVLSDDAPERKLLEHIKKWSGRNNMGRISLAHRGGANRRKYRLIDFKRTNDQNPALVKSLQYDPNRSAFIALIEYSDGIKNYIIAPDTVKVGDKVESGKKAQIRPGNTLYIEDIPDGTFIHNIELLPNSKGKLVRSAVISQPVVVPPLVA